MKKIFTFILIACLFSLQSLTAQDTVNDAGLLVLQMNDYSKYGEMSVKGAFKNNGNVNLTNVIINWQIDDGAVQRYYKDNFDIRPGQSWFFLHPEMVEFSQTKNYFVKVWVASPNGEADSNSDNDTLIHRVQVIQQFPEKHSLVEEVTGAWCGYCPRAPIIFESVVKPAHPNAIMVAIHSGDGMYTSDSRAVMDTYVTGVPCGFVNRSKPSPYSVSMSPEQWKGALDKMDPEYTPADLNVYNYYNPETREWKIDVVADFVLDIAGDLRLNCYIVEDSLTGEGRSWDQRNFFNNSASDPYMELMGAGDPIPNYVHNHVVRKMLGGSWGEEGIIPKEAIAGERYVYSQTFTAPESWNMDNIHLIGLLQSYNSDINKRPILNVKEAQLANITGTRIFTNQDQVKVYPNPSNKQLSVELPSYDTDSKLDILDTQGRVVFSRTIKAGSAQIISINCEDWVSGIYFYRTINRNKMITGRIIHL